MELLEEEISYSSLSSALQRLKEKGLVSVTKAYSIKTGRPRNFYYYVDSEPASSQGKWSPHWLLTKPWREESLNV